MREIFEDIDKTLDQRGEAYGDYSSNAYKAELIFNAVKSDNQNDFAYNFTIANIAGKLARLSNDKMHKDSLIDIIGYITLYIEYIDNLSKGDKKCN